MMKEMKRKMQKIDTEERDICMHCKHGDYSEHHSNHIKCNYWTDKTRILQFGEDGKIVNYIWPIQVGPFCSCPKFTKER